MVGRIFTTNLTNQTNLLGSGGGGPIFDGDKKSKIAGMNRYLAFIRGVRLKGLEPSRLAAPDPKSGASTNFATSANAMQRYEFSHLSPKYSEEKI